MIAFLFPEFEQTLQGLIILSASPVYDKQEIETMRKARNIVISTEPLKKFQQNPTDENFKQVLINNAPCHFPPMSLDKD